MLVRLTSLGIDLRRRGGAVVEMSGRCKGHEATAEDVSSARDGLHGTWRVQMCCVVPEQVDATSTFGRHCVSSMMTSPDFNGMTMLF